ncbi:type II secretion system F family protein [Microbacteriaceae bacterium K1510]|nr:type II secretion system F family protein [Microbacteriaceae bacterium K1510]
MTRFRYTALSLEGSSLTGEIEAPDKSALAADFGRRGLMLVSLDELGKAGRFEFLTWSVDPRAVTAFLSELALVLRSGLPLDEALEVARRDLSPRLSRAIALLRDDVVAGSSLVQALERRKDVFSDDIVAMARIAEVTGDLDGVFAAIAAERERGHRLTEKVQDALRYPAFLISSAVLVLLFFLVHVIPQFSTLFTDSGKDPGTLVRAVMALSQWLITNGQALAIGIFAGLVAVIVLWRVPAVRLVLTRAFLRLPIIGGVSAFWRTTRFLSTLGVLVGQGVPLTDALKVLTSVLGVDAQAGIASVRDAVRRGGRLHEAISETGLFPPMAVRMIRLGEETGELAKVTSEAGGVYGRKLEKKLERVASLISPIAMLAIAGLIGGLMVTIMSALVSVNDAVQ